MTIEFLMKDIVEALPEHSKRLRVKTIREVCLTLDNGKQWQVMAGGHSAVHIGEWGGDYSSWGNTAEDALATCLRYIKLDQA